MQAGLKVKRENLERTLKSIAKLARANQRRGEAVLSFSKDRLTINIPGMQVHTEAEGILLARVRVPVRWLIGLSRTLGPDDPVAITVKGDYLIVGDATVSCTRDHIEHSMFKLPMNATFMDILRAGMQFSRDDIERSGLAGLVDQAEARRDQMIAKAAEVLSSLGVTPEDIRDLVDRCVERFGLETQSGS